MEYFCKRKNSLNDTPESDVIPRYTECARLVLALNLASITEQHV